MCWWLGHLLWCVVGVGGMLLCCVVCNMGGLLRWCGRVVVLCVVYVVFGWLLVWRGINAAARIARLGCRPSTVPCVYFDVLEVSLVVNVLWPCLVVVWWWGRRLGSGVVLGRWQALRWGIRNF